MTGYPLEEQRYLIEHSPVKIDTSLSYCHYTLHDRSLLNSQFLTFAREHSVDVLNAAPLSMRLLTSEGPPSWHPASRDLKDRCRRAAEYCEKQEVDIAKLAIHFTLSQEEIPMTLLSYSTMEEMRDNFHTLHSPLSSVESQTLKEICERYFSPHGDEGWEGNEVNKYWTKLGKRLLMNSLYHNSEVIQ